MTQRRSLKSFLFAAFSDIRLMRLKDLPGIVVGMPNTSKSTVRAWSGPSRTIGVFCVGVTLWDAKSPSKLSVA
jgi:hypothetical protein